MRLDWLQKDSLNAAQLAEKLKDKPSIRTLQNDLSKLEIAGFVIRKGNARSMVWTIVKEP